MLVASSSAADRHELQYSTERVPIGAPSPCSGQPPTWLVIPRVEPSLGGNPTEKSNDPRRTFVSAPLWHGKVPSRATWPGLPSRGGTGFETVTGARQETTAITVIGRNRRIAELPSLRDGVPHPAPGFADHVRTLNRCRLGPPTDGPRTGLLRLHLQGNHGYETCANDISTAQRLIHARQIIKKCYEEDHSA